MSDTKQPKVTLGSRRHFLATASAAAAALASAKTMAAGTCLVTDGDILGPFYLPNAPASATLTSSADKGERLRLTGTVMGPDCATPVPGASVEIWHCDHDGYYDIKMPGQTLAPESYKFRTTLVSGADGKFSVDTIVPGRYAIPPDLPGLEAFVGQIRPAHIHLTVIHPLFLPLTTQIYFEGDPHIAKDPWAKYSKVLSPLAKAGDGSSGAVDIVLANRPGQRRV